MQYHLRLSGAALCCALSTLLLTACGGGGSGDLAGGGEPALTTWNNNLNGSTIKDADNDSLAFTTDGVLYRQQVSYPGVKVRSDASITWDGAVIGTVTLVAAEGGSGQVATTLCAGGAPLNFTFLTDRVDYNCVTPQSRSGGSATTAGGTTPQGSSRSFISWTGNALDYLVKDADEDYYVVDAGSRQLLFVGTRDDGPNNLANPTAFVNSQVDASANVIISNVIVGYLALVPSTSGSQIAALKCSDGRRMRITSAAGASTQARHACDGAAPGGSDGGNASTGGGSGSTYAFTSFSGSANGICIVDRSGDCFAIDNKTGLLSFMGPVTAVAINDSGATPSRTYGNARGIFNGSTLVGLSVGGVRLADVSRVNLDRVGGGTGPAFVCNGQYYAEIFEDPNKPGDAILQCSSQQASF